MTFILIARPDHIFFGKIVYRHLPDTYLLEHSPHAAPDADFGLVLCIMACLSNFDRSSSMKVMHGLFTYNVAGWHVASALTLREGLNGQPNHFFLLLPTIPHNLQLPTINPEGTTRAHHTVYRRCEITTWTVTLPTPLSRYQPTARLPNTVVKT
jgi:hypothetical protein